MVIAGDSGKSSLGIGFRKVFKFQVCRNNCRLSAHDPLINAQKQLGRDKTVGKFGSQVINDQKIAVKNKFLCACVFLSGKCRPCKEIEKIKCREIHNAMRRLQKLMGNAVGKKCLADSCISVEKEILEGGVKIFDKASGYVIGAPRGLTLGEPCCFVLHCIRIVIKRKVVKVLFFKNFF